MIVDGIQDKFLDDTITAINIMVAFILKLVWLYYCMHQYFFANATKSDRQHSTNTGEVNLLLTKKIPHHED